MAKKAARKKTTRKKTAATTSPRRGPDLSHIAEQLRPLAVAIDDLTPDPHNARRHNERNLQTIAASLQTFGQVKPIVITDEGIVIAGNGTIEASRTLGWTHVAAVKFPNADQARAYALADNRTAELAEWDLAVLDEQIAELQADADFDMGAIGFDEKEIEALRISFDDDSDDKPHKEPTTTKKTPKPTVCPSCGHSF